MIAPLFFSCNKAEILPDIQEEEVINVPITLAGLDLEVGQEPMTRAGETMTYYVAVLQDGSPYAWYCMNSFDDVTVSLVKGHSYEFEGYVAYDIKGYYFWHGITGGGLVYGGSYHSNGFEYDSGNKYTISSPLRTYNYKMLVCSESFTEAPSSVTLNMYNAYYGIKANATNLKGTLSIALGKEVGHSESYGHTITLTNDSPSATDFIHFLYPLEVLPAAKTGQDFSKNVNIDIMYTDEDGNTSVLHSGQITVSRLKYTTLNIRMTDHAGAKQSVSLSMESGNMGNGDSLDFEF